MRDIPSLTGLRGIAAVWVMLFHISLLAPLIGAAWLGRIWVSSVGWVGVDLFFVLSGFILMWVHGTEFVRPTASVTGRFALARIVRVYPLSLAVLGLLLLLALADPGFVAWYRLKDADNFSLSAFARTAFLATRWVGADGGDWNQPVWSLSVELVGYAAFPLLAWLMVRCSLAAAIATAAVALTALALFQIAVGTAGSNTIDQASALARMACCFTAGMAICRARQRVADGAARWAGMAAILVCIGIGLACHFQYGRLLTPTGFAVLIFCLSFRAGSVDRFLSSTPVLFLGRISFPLYLVHVMPLLWLVWHFSRAPLAPLAATGVVFAYAASCIGLAALLHHLVERPSHRWIRRVRPAPSPVLGLEGA